LILLSKRKIILFLASSFYLGFLFYIKDNNVIVNNSKNNIAADAYFYTEMKIEYFKKNKVYK